MFISYQFFKISFLPTWAFVLIRRIVILSLEISSLLLGPQGSVCLVGVRSEVSTWHPSQTLCLRPSGPDPLGHAGVTSVGKAGEGIQKRSGPGLLEGLPRRLTVNREQSSATGSLQCVLVSRASPYHVACLSHSSLKHLSPSLSPHTHVCVCIYVCMTPKI